MKTLTLFLALLAARPAFPQTKIDFLQKGRDFTNLFYERKSNEIWAALSPQMRNLFGEADAILGFYLQIKAQDGPESTVLEEHVRVQEDLVEYERIAVFQKVSAPMIVQWTFDRAGVVVGFVVHSSAVANSQFLDYQDNAALRLPFNGTWLILSAGGSVAENHHADSVDQRFAVDVAAIRHARTFSGDGSRPEQYFCFGKPVLAPAAATVAAIHDGVPDNPVNAPFAGPAPGNFVVLDLGNSEYFFLAHLKLGSIQVQSGDKLQPGQKIAQCGNSGNSPVPHLHMHMQNTPDIFKGEGLPMQFRKYLAGKKLVDSAELKSGEIIRNSDKK